MSYLLDTNIISELSKPEPNPHVLKWLNGNPIVFISTITQAELLYGVDLLEEGKRKQQLRHATHAILDLFHQRILSFCPQSANYYPKIVIQRKKQGKPILMADALIASIALANHLTIVSRNVKDFNGIDDLMIFNPFG